MNNKKFKYCKNIFDSQYYLNVNIDVKKASIDPFSHWINYGIKEGRNPNPFFSIAYLSSNNFNLSNYKEIYRYLKNKTNWTIPTSNIVPKIFFDKYLNISSKFPPVILLLQEFKNDLTLRIEIIEKTLNPLNLMNNKFAKDLFYIRKFK